MNTMSSVGYIAFNQTDKISALMELTEKCMLHKLSCGQVLRRNGMAPKERPNIEGWAGEGWLS